MASLEPSDLARIFPRIYANYGHPMYAGDTGSYMDKPIDLGGPVSMLTKPLVGDLMLQLGIDRGSHYELLQRRHLEALPGATLDDLVARAIENLVGDLGDIDGHGDLEQVMLVAAGGNHEAALLVHDEFWDSVTEGGRRELFVGVPARDLLLLVDASTPGALERIKGRVAALFANPEISGQLSKGVFHRKGRRLALVGHASL